MADLSAEQREGLERIAHPELIPTILGGVAGMTPAIFCPMCGCLLPPDPPDVAEGVRTAQVQHTSWHEAMAVLMRDAMERGVIGL